MTVSPSPLVQRRRLRAELRQARQDAGLTQETVAEKMDWSLSKLIRIETGAVGISTNDLAALLRLYNIKDPQRVRALVAQGKEARKQTWWSKYRTVLPPTYFQYIEYETSASIIRSYETLAVPGLLQTEQYATAITQRNRLNLPPRTIRALVEVRMRRQELLFDQPGSPLLFFILDEAVIQRLAGAADLREAQFEKLISVADKPQVTIEVVPFAVGLHPGINENFSLLEFDDPGDDNVLYFESGRESSFSRDSTEEITAYRELFEDLREMSLGPKGTSDYLIEVANAFRLATEPCLYSEVFSCSVEELCLFYSTRTLSGELARDRTQETVSR